MPDNTDINVHLREQMMYKDKRDGKRLFVLPCYGDLSYGNYLYRSMPIQEAKNWFDTEWLPPASGIPWSTSWEYSRREIYFHAGSPIQLEVSAHDILPRIRLAGAVPKNESLTEAAETWGTGPAAEIGRHGSSEENVSLQQLYSEYKGQLPNDLRGAGKNYPSAKARIIQNYIFRLMFKDKIWTARVVARLFD